MPSILKKLLPSGFLPMLAIVTFALTLAAPNAQAHNCLCEKKGQSESKHGTHKLGVKKASSKLAKTRVTSKKIARLARKRNPRPTLFAGSSTPEFKAAIVQAPVLAPGYRRIHPEQTCNMEPAFAVPACEARLKAAAND